MNYITQVTTFYGTIIDDDRLTAFHVSMYLGLFQLWNKNRFENPLPVSRKEVMQVSKIGSTHTYYKVLSELHKWGYIEYLPEKNPLRNSLVNMRVLGRDHQQEGHLAPGDQVEVIQGDSVDQTGKSPTPPPLEQDVRVFFEGGQSNEAEALKFFNHYTSNGWLVGGRSPMVDWHASALKWISNCSPNINLKKGKSPGIDQDKNYDEPL